MKAIGKMGWELNLAYMIASRRTKYDLPHSEVFAALHLSSIAGTVYDHHVPVRVTRFWYGTQGLGNGGLFWIFLIDNYYLIPHTIHELCISDPRLSRLKHNHYDTIERLKPLHMLLGTRILIDQSAFSTIFLSVCLSGQSQH